MHLQEQWVSAVPFDKATWINVMWQCDFTKRNKYIKNDAGPESKVTLGRTVWEWRTESSEGGSVHSKW